jgi:hypothetical protein
MNVKVEKKGYSLHVFVSMSPRKRDEADKACKTDTVLEWLAKNCPEYQIAKLASAPVLYVHNSRGASRLSGKWAFDLQKPVEKPVQKPAEPAAIEKPTPTPPKTRKRTTRTRRKTKATTTKEE